MDTSDKYKKQKEIIVKTPKEKFVSIKDIRAIVKDIDIRHLYHIESCITLKNSSNISSLVPRRVEGDRSSKAFVDAASEGGC